MPGAGNEYMRLSAHESDDEENVELRELVTSTGMADGMRKTQRAKSAADAKASSSAQQKRERERHEQTVDDEAPRDALEAAYEVLNFSEDGPLPPSRSD